jgi:hypothetical protein
MTGTTTPANPKMMRRPATAVMESSGPSTL